MTFFVDTFSTPWNSTSLKHSTWGGLILCPEPRVTHIWLWDRLSLSSFIARAVFWGQQWQCLALLEGLMVYWAHEGPADSWVWDTKVLHWWRGPKVVMQQHPTHCGSSTECVLIVHTCKTGWALGVASSQGEQGPSLSVPTPLWPCHLLFLLSSPV